jgi:hypothetical protein
METESTTAWDARLERRAHWLDQAEAWFTKALQARHDGATLLATVYTSNGNTALHMATLYRPQQVAS